MQIKRSRLASANADFQTAELGPETRSYGMTSLLWRQFEFVVGLALVVVAIFSVISLATWNAADPSFSHATDAQVTNAMGYPGAVVSDILMQFFGLASLAVLAPLVFWSYALVVNSRWNFRFRRLALWALGSVLTAALLGCIPATNSWPLPTGLGGVIGDLGLKIPGLLFGGYPTGLAAFFVGAALIAPAYLAMAIGSGFYWKNAGTQANTGVDAEFDDDEPSGLLRFVSIGACIHFMYVVKSSFKRLLPQRRRKIATTGQTKRVEPGMNSPVDFELNDDEWPVDEFSSQGQDAAFVESDDDWASSNTLDQGAGPAITPSARVAPAAPAPKPGVRVKREAQTSLLKDGDFELPPVHLLNEPKNIVRDESLSPEALEQNARVLEGVLEDFGVKGEIIHVRPGPVVTMYELEPAPGIKSSRVIGLAEDIARSMSAIAARVAVVPGRNAIGIELPNNLRETVYFREMIASANYDNSKAKLAMALGKTIAGEPVIADLAKMPHLLVAGTTGSGKSVAINTMLLSLLYKLSPAECRLIMIDPKMLELSVYDGIPHLLTPVVTDPKKAVVALKWTVREMEQRYKNMSKLGVRNIDGFNARVKEAMAKGEEITRTVQTGFDRETGEAIYETEALDLDPMPYIVIVIDEMADLMMVAGKDIEGAVQRLAQMARAAGIHVVMATQRPSVDVITGTIKANFPTRISFQVTSKIDSRTILGEMGAEQLLGMGDMLYMAGGGRIQRVHGPFVSDEEVEDIVKHLKLQGVPQYLEAVTEDDDEEDGDSSGGGGPVGDMSSSDDPYDQAVAVVLRDRKASTSYIQRRLGIGYNRAASLIERMEEEGVIGPANHAGKREILVPSEEDQQMGGMM
jgi:S-DNA-T family DNA segregation ATPase FtsK/SpoIIIE